MVDITDSLGARGLRVQFDTTGRVAVASPRVILEHNFANPMLREQGWTQLWTPGEATNCGTTQWINRGGVGRLAIRANTQANGLSMGICRSTSYFGQGRFQLEMAVSIEPLNYDTTAYPKAYTIGADSCRDDGIRRFFNLVYLNYDETAAAPAGKWMVDMGVGFTGGKTINGAPGGRFVDVPGGSMYWPTNENKALPFMVVIEFDTTTGRYLGFKFGNLLAVGSLAATPNDSLSSLGAMQQENLPTYAAGHNLCASIYNRTTGTKTKGQINVHFSRLTFLGA